MSDRGGQGGREPGVGGHGGQSVGGGGSCPLGLLWAELEGVVAHELVSLLGCEGGGANLHADATCLAVVCRRGLVFLLLLEDLLKEGPFLLGLGTMGALGEGDHG